MAQINTYGNPKETKAQKIAKAERLREFGPKQIRVKAEAEVTEEQNAQRQADTQRLADLIAEHETGKMMFYRFMKSAVNSVLKDTDRALEAGIIASRLGITNPITSSVMSIGEGSGVIQDKVRFVEALLARFAKRYRATGFIDKDQFEYPVGG